MSMIKTMLTKSRFSVVTITISVALLSACHRSGDYASEFNVLFNGFHLLNVGDASGQLDVSHLNGLTAEGKIPAEPKLIPGRFYILRKQTKLSNETLALRTFPERLAAIGARITKAPRSDKDLMYLYIGGPIFRIEFDKDGHHGTLYNWPHTSEQSDENWEELVLVYR